MDFFFFKQKTAYEITEGDWSSDVCSSDLAQTPSWAVQCGIPQDWQTRACSSHAGCSSTRHCAMPWSAQKSSAHTEHRHEHTSQAQCSCRHTTSAAGGRLQRGQATVQAAAPT